MQPNLSFSTPLISILPLMLSLKSFQTVKLKLGTKMQIVIPMAGKAIRFKNSSIETPKPLLNVLGVPLAVRSAQSIKNFGTNHYLFISLVEHKKWFIESQIKDFFPNSNFIYLREPTRSPVETCLKVVNELEIEKPVVFNDCDQIFKCPKFDSFLETQEVSATNSGSILYFRGKNPSFSYIKTLTLGDQEFVQSAVEKQVISDFAVCGTYYFKSVSIFKELAKDKMKNISKREVFMIELIDQLAKITKDVIAFETLLHKSLGTPEEYAKAINDNALKEIFL